MFARGVVYLHAACPERSRRGHLPVPKSPSAKSRVSITSKLIQTKGLQVLHFCHLRKTGGRGSYRLVHTPPLVLNNPLSRNLLFLFPLPPVAFITQYPAPIAPPPPTTEPTNIPAICGNPPCGYASFAYRCPNAHH